MKSRNILCFQPDQICSDRIEHVPVTACDQAADLSWLTLGRTIPLHAYYCVADAQSWFGILIQIDQYIGEVLCPRIFIMEFRLRCSGDRTKKVLDCACQAHHSVGLQLTQVDNRICLAQICSIWKLFCHNGVREADFHYGKIIIQFSSVLFCLPEPAYFIYDAKIGCGIHTSRSIPQNGFSAKLT